MYGTYPYYEDSNGRTKFYYAEENSRDDWSSGPAPELTFKNQFTPSECQRQREIIELRTALQNIKVFEGL